MQIDQLVLEYTRAYSHYASLHIVGTFTKQPENEGQRTVPHEVKAPVNGKSKEDWCNFEQSPKRGSPNFDVSADAVSDGDILDSEIVYKEM